MKAAPQISHEINSLEPKPEKDTRVTAAKDYLKDFNLQSSILKSSKSKTMLQINNDELDSRDHRRNSLMNLAFGWERTFTYYNDVSARFDEILVQEAMWKRLADIMSVDNYKKLVETFTADVVDNYNDPYSLHKISFTYDPEGTHRVS